MAAKRADEQLRLHAVGIRDEHADDIRSGGGQHKAKLRKMKKRYQTILGTGDSAQQGNPEQNLGSAFKMGILISVT